MEKDTGKAILASDLFQLRELEVLRPVLVPPWQTAYLSFPNAIEKKMVVSAGLIDQIAHSLNSSFLGP